MQRQDIENHIVQIFENEFEIENPENEVDLRETYGFDSIDAIELLAEIEMFLGFELTLDQKKQAMEIRTIAQIFDYVEDLAKSRTN